MSPKPANIPEPPLDIEISIDSYVFIVIRKGPAAGGVSSLAAGEEVTSVKLELTTIGHRENAVLSWIQYVYCHLYIYIHIYMIYI